MLAFLQIQGNAMTDETNINASQVARWVGASFLATIVIGIIGSMTIAQGIDINLNADIAGTADNMLAAEQRLQAKAYLGLLMFALSVVINLGLYALLRKAGPLLAGWSLIVGLCASVLALLSSVFAMNAAHVAGNSAYMSLTDADGRLLLAGLQATSDYTSFHLSLVLSSIANAGFFYLLLRSALIPKLISGFGVFASLFVAVTIVARDFIPTLGANTITMAFMLCNLIAMISLALYMLIKGVREV